MISQLRPRSESRGLLKPTDAKPLYVFTVSLSLGLLRGVDTPGVLMDSCTKFSRLSRESMWRSRNLLPLAETM